jgi:hypothetical protein
MVGSFHSIGLLASQTSWKLFPDLKTASFSGFRWGPDVTNSVATIKTNDYKNCAKLENFEKGILMMCLLLWS